jgi:hypothetical protein
MPPAIYKLKSPLASQAAMKARLKIFNANMLPIMQEIKANNVRYGMRKKDSGVKGVGVFTRCCGLLPLASAC